METVTSKDSTVIAYEKRGNGPPVVLVDGAGSYRKWGTAQALPPVLSRYFTVYAYDRRGRGDSGNTLPYAIEREIEDLRAVMDVAGGSPFVYGHSSGAALVLYAMASGLKPSKAALYEAPYVVVNPEDTPPPVEAKQRLESAIAEGRLAKAMNYWLNKVLGIPRMVVFLIRVMLGRHWTDLVAVAATLPYDLAIMDQSRFSVPRHVTTKITVPCLVLGGGKSPLKLRNAVKAMASAIPGARLQVLEGQSHNVSPQALAGALAEFFR